LQQTEEAPIMNHYEKDIVEMKSDIKILEKEVSDLKTTTTRHDEQITTLNNTLKKIDDNTTWIKRTIIGAIITAISSGVIGGAIAIFYGFIQK
jgi:predicted RNase H-like nuclease (RuvC/YqgF family)